MNNSFFAVGCLLCAIAVGAGAMGAHALKDKLDLYFLDIYKTAVLYHFLHSLGIIILSSLTAEFQNKRINISIWLLFIGIIFFSGSLYMLSTSHLWTDSSLSWLGPVTPFGGMFFIAGWVLAGTAVFSKKI